MRCPLCKAPAAQDFRPFCSKACKDRDLINWLDDRYAVSVRSDEADDSESVISPPDA